MKRMWIVPALLACALPVEAASTTTWEMNLYEDFLKGKFESVSLTREGQLRLAPKLETVFSSDQPAIWSVARAGDGTLYLGTGHRGRVFRVGPDGKGELLWTADEPEVFAIALDSQGRVYAGTSPNGKVYRIENGVAAEYFDPGSTYIWTLAFDAGGDLYVGAGNEGKVFRVDSEGRGEVYYETGQSHVTALAVDPAGRVLAGTEPNGILYRIERKDKAFVLYDANLPEIRAIVPMADGTVYASALGGSVRKQTTAATAAAAARAAAPIAHTSITVTAAQGGVKINPPAAKPKPAAATAAAPPMIEIAGIEKSALYRIRPDHAVEKLWSSSTENAYDLVAAEGNVHFVTDRKGRLYNLAPDGKVTLSVQTNEAEAIRLLPDGDGYLVTTGNMGRVYRVMGETSAEGGYEAPVHDAARVARWGRLSWGTRAPEAGSISFQTRSGNSAWPDRTWSDWSEPLTDGDGSPITSPNARFIQWRAALRGAAGRSPVLDSVRLAYLPQNDPPRVTAITVTAQTAPASQGATTTGAENTATPAYSITVTDTGEAGASTVSGTPTTTVKRVLASRLQVAWHTEDLDGDKLIHSLYFRGEGETEWKLLEDELEEAAHVIDSDVLADGKYVFRVVSSDHWANPAKDARTGEKVSAPVLVDHTPPVVTLGEARPSDATLIVEAKAVDAASELVRCEYAVDAGVWLPLAPLDGVTDSRRETFRLELPNRSKVERLLVIRAYDSAGNAGLAKLVIPATR